LEFEVQFTTKNVPHSIFDNATTGMVLRFNNEKYKIVANHVLYRIPATQNDLELVSNLKYALENGFATLMINNSSYAVFEATFGTIRGKPATYTTTIHISNIEDVMLQKKYDDLLEKYNALEKSHTCPVCQK